MSPTLPRRSLSVAARRLGLGAHAVSAALVLVLLAPVEGWAQIRLMVGGEEQVERIRPAGERGQQDWRATLRGQREERESEQARRRMTEEERSDLRRQMRDAARGAYRDQAPRDKPRR